MPVQAFGGMKAIPQCELSGADVRTRKNLFEEDEEGKPMEKL